MFWVEANMTRVPQLRIVLHAFEKLSVLPAKWTINESTFYFVAAIYMTSAAKLEHVVETSWVTVPAMITELHKKLDKKIITFIK